MPKQKDFTKATIEVATKFFSNPIEPADPNQLSLPLEQTNINKQSNDIKFSRQTNDTKIDNNDYITKHTHITNKSKHYDERGKREERYGLLLDKQLKEDLKHLANATGSKSINDFIVTILLDYVEQPNNQSKLQRYKEILLEVY